jgi:D-threo-aldose 1-dehydrogenase
MNDAARLATLVRETDMDVVMLAGRYTLLEQDSLDDLMPLCAERGVGVVAAGVFNSGLLARALPGPGANYDYVDGALDALPGP